MEREIEGVRLIRNQVQARIERWPKTAVLDILLICLWVIWVGRTYLDFNPRVIPAGGEFSSVIQAHHLWTRFQQCGLCALWDGSERGGFPAFVDTHASALHPLVIITTLSWGVVNGAKVSLVASFAIAGLGQWWLGHELGLGRLARLWGAWMVIVAGHLSGKMDLGLFSIVLSMTMASLTFPAALRLRRTQHPRDVVLFSIILALLIVAGQGYVQLGLLAMSPLYLILVLAPEDRATRQYLQSCFLLAVCLALLLAAPLLLPLAHFGPHFSKPQDPYFAAAQPLSYYILNLVIDDHAFFTSTALDKFPYPYLYVMFIGWVPVILALLAARYAEPDHKRPLLFLFANAAVALFIGSTLPLQWLHPLWPSLAVIRSAPVIGGLSVPCLIGLAMYSVDKLYHRYGSTTWYRNSSQGKHLLTRWQIAPNGLLLFFLGVSIFQGYLFARHWLSTYTVPNNVYTLLESLKTPTLQWVQPPFGEHIYIEPAVRLGLKLSPGIMAWQWKDRELPTPFLEASRKGQPPDTHLIGETASVAIYRHETDAYATLIGADEKAACLASGSGGFLAVLCDTNFSGELTVLENNWSGWYAWRDGERVALQNGRWLQVEAPAGQHTYLFRYLPWDVPAGVALFLIGCGISFYLWKPYKPNVNKIPHTS